MYVFGKGMKQLIIYQSAVAVAESYKKDKTTAIAISGLNIGFTG